MMTQDKTHVIDAKKRTCRAFTRVIRKEGMPLKNSRGMTLVELIVVCAILAVLASLAIPAYSTYKDLARVSAAMSEIRTIELAINAYTAEFGSKPADLSQVKYGTLKDPWGNTYEYRSTAGTLEFVTGDFVLPPSYGVGNKGDYDLWSKGSDPLSGTALSSNPNIIVRARSGGFVGLASNY